MILGGAVLGALDADAGDPGGVAQDLVQGAGSRRCRTLPCSAFSNRCCCRIFSARKASRRWTRVTSDGDVGEIEGLLHRGVAAADHGDLLAAVEKAVAGGAGGDAAPAKLLLGGQPQIAGAGPGGDDQGVAGVDRRVAR